MTLPRTRANGALTAPSYDRRTTGSTADGSPTRRLPDESGGPRWTRTGSTLGRGGGRRGCPGGPRCGWRRAAWSVVLGRRAWTGPVSAARDDAACKGERVYGKVHPGFCKAGACRPGDACLCAKSVSGEVRCMDRESLFNERGRRCNSHEDCNAPELCINHRGCDWSRRGVKFCVRACSRRRVPGRGRSVRWHRPFRENGGGCSTGAPELSERPVSLRADLAAAIARAGVNPTAEPRACQDVLKSAVADRPGYVAWDVDEMGVTCHPPRAEGRLTARPYDRGTTGAQATDARPGAACAPGGGAASSAAGRARRRARGPRSAPAPPFGSRRARDSSPPRMPPPPRHPQSLNSCRVCRDLTR